MEPLKPLVVLVLFGTILYGAYSVVQKGPSSTESASDTAATGAPAFAPPAVEIAPAATQAAPAFESAAAVAAPPFSASLPAAPPASVPAMPAAAPPFNASATAPAPALPPAALPLQPPAMAAAAVGAAAVTEEAASVSPAAPTYLTAESSPPPAHDTIPAQVPPAAAPGPLDRPDRLATLAPPGVTAATPDTVAPPPSSAASGSSAAFATAWADAHDKLAAGRYAEALAALSVWYDDPSLGLEESQRLEDLLGQLAGTVVYSQQDLLLPPYRVAAGETLPAIAAPLGVSWQLIAKINGISDPLQLVPGEQLKVVRGPFDAVVSVSRRRLSLQLGGNYAGSFPVVVGRQFLGRVGSSVPVVEIRRGAARDVQAVAATTPDPSGMKPAVLLGDGLVIEAAEDPGVANDMSPVTSLVMSVRDLEELLDILGPGSRVLVRQ
jgi:LysM repeat protein